jgi:hypothetical protein
MVVLGEQGEGLQIHTNPERANLKFSVLCPFSNICADLLAIIAMCSLVLSIKPIQQLTVAELMSEPENSYFRYFV